MKNLFKCLVGFFCGIILLACGGGSGDASTLPTVIPMPQVTKIPTPIPIPTYIHAKTSKDCSENYCPMLVFIQPGSFVMGSSLQDGDRDGDEGPQHQVILNYWLAVSAHEVTFEQWDTCVADGGCNGYTPADEGWGRGTRPVINVSWNDAQAYLQWLNGKTAQNYRLLSEAEWEYVARTGMATNYPTGSSISSDQANFSSMATSLTGSFPANAWGVFDMAGNVWEWTQDWYSDSYALTPVDGSANEHGGKQFRVLRGGSWGDESTSLRVSYRNYGEVDAANAATGFRIAKTLP